MIIRLYEEVHRQPGLASWAGELLSETAQALCRKFAGLAQAFLPTFAS
jgi:hypothetical protein